MPRRIDSLGERISSRVLRRAPQRSERAPKAREQLAPVPRAHQEHLEVQMDMLRMAVDLDGPADFGGVGAGREERRDSFVAHFDELDDPLQDWNACIERVRAAPGALWTWLEKAARKRGIVEPPFAVGALIDRLAIVTAERSRHGQLRAPHDLRLERFTDRVGGGERLSLHAEGQNVVQLAGDQHAAAERELGEAEAAIQALFDDAQGSNEATEVGNARDALHDLKQPLLEALARNAAHDELPMTLDCPVCRRTLEAPAEADREAEAEALAEPGEPERGRG